MVGSTEYVRVDVSTHLSALFTASLLIEAEVDTPVDAGVIDVVGNLLEGVVLQNYSHNRGVSQGDQMMSPAIESLEYLACRTTQAGVR